MPHFVDVKLNDLLSVPPPYVDTILLLSISVYTQVRTISTTTLAHFFLIFILPVRSWRDYFFFVCTNFSCYFVMFQKTAISTGEKVPFTCKLEPGSLVHD